MRSWAIAAVFSLTCVISSASAEELVQRSELNRAPLTGVEGMEVIVSKLVLQNGGRIVLHTHPGDEHAVIVKGGKVELPNGKIVDFADDTPMFFPEGPAHGGVTSRNETPIIIYTTHIVRAGEPLVTIAE
ncbi:hypothetical protein [Cognatishimia activa]|uniref:hypothetical protein n=1 Tax=Cognatishimia activa TaxID=1715691 RepID=UPI0022309345|nr:hypothetical protein [Cognatishimia activa]UZD90066.1 hypothetical protein M0D42_10750 [Cognatishimia activa]